MKYDVTEIIRDASYCLNCKNKPCKFGCPLGNNIPDFIKYIKEQKNSEAFEVLSETTIFEPICGRICPQKKQCEGSCVRGIKGQSVEIGRLEKFVGDYALENKIKQKVMPAIGKKIAVIGSGPAGLAVANYLSTKGYLVTIYEKHSKLGGLLRYGIPEFRLSKKLLDSWLENYVLNKNIEVKTNTKLGRNITLEQLKEKYEKIILSFGANVSNKMNIPGKELEFVLGGNELLEYRKMPDFKDKKVVVIGGGNVAIDSARTIKKLGAKSVNIIYRRSETEMPAEKKEIEEAKRENIEFTFQTNILKISKGDLINKVECIKTKLVPSKTEDRKYPVNIENSNYTIDTNYVIMAIGSKADKKTINELNLETTSLGYIKVDENYKTTDNKIYAIGDLIGNKQTVAWAAKSGFECAKRICK